MFESNKNHIGEACQNGNNGHDDESIINNNKMDLQTKKTRGGNHKRAPWRNNSDGTYNNKPIDDNYFRDYYRTKLCEKITCDICNKEISKGHFVKHKLLHGVDTRKFKRS